MFFTPVPLLLGRAEPALIAKLFAAAACFTRNSALFMNRAAVSLVHSSCSTNTAGRRRRRRPSMLEGAGRNQQSSSASTRVL